MSEKAANVQRNLCKTFRKPEELLLKTTLKDHKKVWLNGWLRTLEQYFMNGCNKFQLNFSNIVRVVRLLCKWSKQLSNTLF